jgi:beta-N-acetylhexosaminidase
VVASPEVSLEVSPRASPEASPDVSLDAKIGQMLMVGFRGLMVGEDHFIVRDIRERSLGGVVLFDYDVPNDEPLRNVESPAQVKALIDTLQSVSPTPLLVAVDHEGGIVTRLREEHGFPSTLSHQALGEADDIAFTREQAAMMAQTLAELGFNLNLAPVVDVNVNPANPIIAKHGRSFSGDPEIVTRQALEFVRAHHKQGVLCTLKHFPGHGSSTGDSHRGFVDITETWTRSELLPYARIIGAGLADAIMTAHVFNANLDADYPATLSHRIITGILREELGFGGVVISDDMQMRAIVDHHGFEAAIQGAIEAGVDVIAFANNSVYEEDVAVRAATLIKQAVQNGAISVARIDEAYRRVVRLKQRLVSEQAVTDRGHAVIA